MSEKAKELIIDVIADIVGSAIFAVGVDVFTTPNEIAPGGVTGIATMIHSMTGIQVGTLSFLLNIPLLIVGFCVIGKKFTFQTLRSLIILSVITDIFDIILPAYTGNIIISSVFGGALIGAGMGIIFMRGSTTGGTDILGRLVLRKFPHIPLGKILLAIDVIIVSIAGFYYGALEASLYAMVSIYATEKALDGMLYGTNEGIIAYAISEKYEEISRKVMEVTDRGTTLLDGEGGYTHSAKKLVLCAMPKRQFSLFKKTVFEIDPDAFVMVAPATNIIGEGFHRKFDEG